MATTRWRGDQGAFAQVTTSTVTGTWAGSDTATATVNGKAITVTVGTDVAVADIAEILGRAINGDALKNDESRNTTGDLLGEFSDITATYSGAVLTLTGDTSGEPFTVTFSETTAGTGAMGAASTTTSPDGPNELSASNVTGGSLSGAGNTLIFENSAVSCTYGLDQSAAGTWTEIRFESGFTGDIGLPMTRVASPTSFQEYLDRYLNIRASKVVIGEGTGRGSGRMLIDLGSVQSAVYVRGSATSKDTGLHAVQILGTHASNTLFVDGGTVDIAPDAGDVSTFSSVTVSGTGTVRMSDGVTLTTLEVTGNGSVDLSSDSALSDITTITVRDSASVTIRGDNAVTTLYGYGGTVYYLSSGTVTTVKVGAKGSIDASENAVGCTFTNTELEAGASINDPGSMITFTNAIDLGLGGLEDVTLKLGKGINVLPS